MTLGGRKGGKFGKPVRGRAQRFSSANDPNAYVLTENNPKYRKPKDVKSTSEDEGDSEEVSGSEQESGSSENSETESSGGEEGEEEKNEGSEQEEKEPKKVTKGISKLNLQDDMPSAKESEESQPQKNISKDERPITGSELEKGHPKLDAPRELTRKEREAIEAQKAREHYLKMKAKTDMARLEQVKRRREEEAAKHAASQREKEAARQRR